MRVAFIDLEQRIAEERDELRACIDRVLADHQLILGPSVASFEAAAAQATGVAHVVGLNSGTDSLMMALSAHRLKLVAALGDAGFLATNDSDAARRVALHRTHGLESRDTCVEYGVNSRLDALHAAILELRLGRLSDVIERRRRNAAL